MSTRKKTEPGGRTTLLPLWRRENEKLAQRDEPAVEVTSTLIPIVLSRTAAKSRIVIGRGPTADVVVPDPMISRLHFELFRNEEQWYARDLDSKNGGHVNGIEFGNEPVPISPNDRITIGAQSPM